MALYNNFQSDYKKKLDAYNALYPSTKGVSAEKLLPIVVSTKAAYDAASKAYAEAKNTYDNGASKALEEARQLYNTALSYYLSLSADTSLTVEQLHAMYDTEKQKLAPLLEKKKVQEADLAKLLSDKKTNEDKLSLLNQEKNVLQGEIVSKQTDLQGITKELELLQSKICKIEAGLMCTDGKDNDEDGALDCQDADCGNNVRECSICGNTVQELGEVCDDGNTVSGDGCSKTCQKEDITIGFCGDMRCDANETSDTCSGDCKERTINQCGNMTCDMNENEENCITDCSSQYPFTFISGTAAEIRERDFSDEEIQAFSEDELDQLKNLLQEYISFLE